MKWKSFFSSLFSKSRGESQAVIEDDMWALLWFFESHTTPYFLVILHLYFTLSSYVTSWHYYWGILMTCELCCDSLNLTQHNFYTQSLILCYHFTSFLRHNLTLLLFIGCLWQVIKCDSLDFTTTTFSYIQSWFSLQAQNWFASLWLSIGTILN